MTLIINMFGGPGAGKSTMAAGLFHGLKSRGVICELITEKAKYFTWERNKTALSNQLFVTAHQIYHQEIVEQQVDVVVTDSPIILGLFYYREQNLEIREPFRRFLRATFDAKNNLNVYLKRGRDYNSIGRSQTEEEACMIDEEVWRYLERYGIPTITIKAHEEGLKVLTEKVLERIRE